MIIYIMLLLIAVLIKFTLQGTINPGLIAISNTIANKAQYSDYSFYLLLTTTVPPGGQIIIEFPIQYQAGLGITQVTASTCNYQCSINSNVVTLYFTANLLAQVSTLIQIFGVLNPPNSGGTGNFIVRTMRYQFTYDENLIFAVMGIADTIVLLSSTDVQPDKVAGTYQAGQTSKYNFAFKTNTNLPTGSQIKLGIPIESGYQISQFPSCELYPINGLVIPGQIQCQTQGSQIVVTGFLADIGSGSEVGISVAMNNPPYSIITGKFSIQAFRNNTSVIYTWSNNINSIQITPGNINGVVLASLVPNQRQGLGKVMDYQLQFLPSNPLPDGSVIVINFPPTFQVVVNTATTPYDYVYLNQGLDDVDEINTLQIATTTNSILLSGYLGITKPVLIVITFRALNPSSPGATSALQIYTYLDSTQANIIDQNIQDAITFIENIRLYQLVNIQASLSPTSIIASQYQSQGQPIDLTFTITPVVFIPGSATMNILLASQFSVGTVTSANCISSFASALSSVTCQKSDNLITMQNPSTVSYNVATSSQFKLQGAGFISSPLLQRVYLVNIDIYSGTTILQTYNDYITIVALQLISPIVYLIGQEVSVVGFPKYSILNIQLQTLQAIPEGSFVIKNTELQGRIEVQFGSPTYLWDNSLGTNLIDGSIIPCKAIYGLLPIPGKNIQCNIFLGDGGLTKVPKVVIRNFQQIASLTQVIFHIPKILNPLGVGASPMRVNLVQYNNRQRSEINNAPFLTVNLVAQAGSIQGTTQVPMAISSFQLNGIFNLGFNPKFGNDIQQNSYFLLKLPGYDRMFIPPEDSIVCYIDLFITPCTRYDGIDWILFKTEPGQKHYYALNPYVTVQNLVWPRYANSVGKVQWTLIDGTSMVELESKILGYISNSNFPPPLFNDFIQSVIKSAVKGKNFVGLEFEFSFIPTDLIPNGGSVLLTFPTEFTLEASFPQPIFRAPQFLGVSDNLPLMFTTLLNVLTISNIQQFPGGAPFSIIVSGLRTPLQAPPSGLAQNWAIQSNYQGNFINQRLNFDSFTYGQQYQPGVVVFESVVAFPNNQLELATYSFSFVLSTQLDVGGEITIVFPSQFYPTLPTAPDNARCTISGGLNSFYSCTLQGSSYVIITDDVYNSGMLLFTINNILNPLQGVTEGFQIRTRYDQSYLDLTDQLNLQSRTVMIYPKAEPILIQNIDFDPRNEGEISSYIFTFIPSSLINSSNTYIIITFPQQYDTRLGNQIICSSTAQIVCTVTNRQVWITGVNNYVPSGSSPILITINGVVNPNYNDNDQLTSVFTIGTLIQNTYNYVDYNANAGQLQMSKAPGWAYLYNVVPQNTFSRWIFNPTDQGYLFNFTSRKGIPPSSSRGCIIVDFPMEFDLPNQNVACFPYIYASNKFASNLQCQSQQNSVRIYGNTVEAQGIIIFNLTQVVNPPDEVTSHNFIVKVYDGFKKEILEKSFLNLDPWVFSYTFPGPLIKINNDQIIVVEAGTQTQDLYFTVDYPCALNLTYSPILSQFTIIPSSVQLFVTDLNSVFRISVPEDTQAGIYYITWSCSGELSTPMYTPVKKTQLTVTNIKNIRIDVQALNEIPLNGTSLDQYISVQFAPDLGVEILLRSLTKTVILSTKSLMIPSGQNVATFRVSSNQSEYNDQLISGLDRTDVREIQLTLEGINKNVYTLSTNVLQLVFIPSSKDAPFITELLPFNTTQTTTFVILGAGEQCVIYYMIALVGTDQPPLSELISAGPAPIMTTLSRYFTQSIGTSNQAQVVITHLKAQTPYVIYAVAQNRQANYSDIKSVLFQTSDRFNASIFSVAFKQSYLNEAEREYIKQQIAFVLSLPYTNYTKKVIEVKVFDTSTIAQNLRNLQLASTKINLNIISIPTTQNFGSPLSLVAILNARKLTLNSSVPNFDALQIISGTEFIPYVPNFIESPVVNGISLYSCSVEASLDNFGFIFLIATETALDKQKPKSVQVWWGYNSRNQVQPANYVAVDIKFTKYTVTISNLKPDTDYNMYVVPGSAHPGYPDLPLDATVQLVPCRTLAFPPSIYLNINDAIFLQALILLLLICH